MGHSPNHRHQHHSTAKKSRTMDTGTGVDELFHGMQWDDLVAFTNKAVENTGEGKVQKIHSGTENNASQPVRIASGESVMPMQTYMNQAISTSEAMVHAEVTDNVKQSFQIVHAGPYMHYGVCTVPPAKRGRHADASVPIDIDVTQGDAGYIDGSEGVTLEAPHSTILIPPTSSYVPQVPTSNTSSIPVAVHQESSAAASSAVYNSSTSHAAEYDSEESSITEDGNGHNIQTMVDPGTATGAGAGAGAGADSGVLEGGKPKKRSRTSASRLVWTAEMVCSSTCFVRAIVSRCIASQCIMYYCIRYSFLNCTDSVKPM